MKKSPIIFALLVTFLLCVYGLNWGLPSRWCIDEPVNSALGMMAEKSITPKGDFFHPTFHYFMLIIFLAPVLLILKITGYPLDLVREAASVSWIHLSVTDPKFSTLVYITARLSSAVFAVLIAYLTYRLAEKCFSKKAGFLSVLFLSVTMGFISEAHTAKSTILLILMVILTVFSCAYYYDKRTIKKYIFPFFLGGLALATKYNGAITLFPLGYYLIETMKKDVRVKYIYTAFIFFAVGFFLGFPGIVSNLRAYLDATAYYRTRYIPSPADSPGLLFMSGLGGYVVLIKDIFGAPLFLLILAGLLSLFFIQKRSFAFRLILITIIPYCIFFMFNPKPFEVKYIVLIVPFLVILASGGWEMTSRISPVFRKSLIVTIALIWVASASYAITCDLRYAQGDIRYAATDWIESNISPAEKIIVVGHPEWVIHNRLFKDRTIIVLNEDEQYFNEKYNRYFSHGEQRNLASDEVRMFKDELRKDHRYFLIYPVYASRDRNNFWKTVEIRNDYGINLDEHKTIKQFFQGKRSIFGKISLGGYEPEKIVITHGLK